MVEINSFASLMKKRREEGWSLVNTLVTVALTLIIGTVAVSLIVVAQRGSNQFTDTVMTEAELNNAMSSITRQLTTAESIVLADDNLVKVANVENDTRQDTTFFAWTPAPEAKKWDEFKPYLTGDNATGQALSVSDLPNFPAVVSATSSYDNEGNPVNEKPAVRVLVNGYIQDPDTPLFTYFNGDDAALTTPVAEDTVNSIQRVQVQLRAIVEGRDAPMELASSITPRAGLSGTLGESNIGSNEVPASVTLTGTLPPRTTESTLTWNAVDGADSYTLYRENNKQEVSPKVVGTTQGTTMKDPGLTAGETYRYHVVATNVNGLSPKSNVVALTATPPAPVLSGEVNESFHNDLSWTKSNGAVGYRILKDGAAWKSVSGINTTTITDTDTKAGESHKYKVVAYNNAGTGSGNTLGAGDSPWSNEITLFSNPAAPVLSGSVNKGDRNLKWTSVPGATGYELKRISPNAKTFPTQTTLTRVDNDQIKSNDFRYQVRAKNPSGWSDWSNIVTLNPVPAPVQPKVYDYTDSSTTYNMMNRTTWPDSAQATYYEWRISKVDRGSGDVWTNDSWTNTGTNRQQDHNLPARDSDSISSYDVRACNYTGCSTHKWDMGTQPPSLFEITGYQEKSRTGYHSIRGDMNRDLDPQAARFMWTESTNADNYYFDGAYKTQTLGANSRDVWIDSYTPGQAWEVKMDAKGNQSGITRSAKQYKWQSTPAQPHNIRFSMQYTGASNGKTRMAFIADGGRYRASDGNHDSIQLRYGDRYKWQDNQDWRYTNTPSEAWATWTGQRSTAGFWKKDAGPANLGGIAWGRTYKSLASGYAGSTISQDSQMGRGWWMTDGQDDGQFNGGYRGLWSGTSTNISNRWTSYDSGNAAPDVSDWTTVPYSQRNYPFNHENGFKRDYYMVTSR